MEWNQGQGGGAPGPPGPPGPPGSVSRFAANVGDGVSTSIYIVHGLASRDIQVEVYVNSAPWNSEFCDVERVTINVVRLKFTYAPALNSLRVVVLG